MPESENLDKHINDHEKHYRALVRWCIYWSENKKRKYRPRGDAFDLCDLFAEGSTVAHAIWEKYKPKTIPGGKL